MAQASGVEGQKLCPRCGAPYRRVEYQRKGSNVYVLFVHDRKRRCYAGAKQYVYVSRLHEDLGLILKGLEDGGRLAEYFNILLGRLIAMAGSDSTDRRLQALEALERAKVRIERVLGRAASP